MMTSKGPKTATTAITREKERRDSYLIRVGLPPVSLGQMISRGC